jgi:hypothetical protein
MSALNLIEPFLIGPVVGEMSMSGSVVLLYSTSEDLTLLVLEGAACVKRVIPCAATYQEATKWSRKPARLVLHGLTPGGVYTLSWSRPSAISTTGSSFPADTAPPSPVVFSHTIKMLVDAAEAELPRVVVISCNRPDLRYNTNLWADVHERDLRPGDVCLMIGDQVYADPLGMAFIKGWCGKSGIDSSTPAAAQAAPQGEAGRGCKTGRGAAVRQELDAASNERAARGLYAKLADLYQYNWMQPDTRKVLATAATLMVKDDHELMDDRLQGKFAAHPACRIYLEVALRAYRDFQLALRLTHAPDAPATPSTGALYTWPIARGAAVHLVDCSYQGFDSAAVESVQRFLQTPGLTRAIVACGSLPFPDPPAPSALSHFIFGDRAPPGQMGVWSLESSTHMFKALLDFSALKGCPRAAAVIGGDWHASLTGVVTRSSSSGSGATGSGTAGSGTAGSGTAGSGTAGAGGQVAFMCSSGITNVCTQVDVDGCTDHLRKRSGPGEIMPGMCVACDPLVDEPQRNYGVVYMPTDSKGGGLTVCNKFASHRPSKCASLGTLCSYVMGLLRAAYWGWS